jgi:DNA/RNA endonuclease YhcR with UshA esterase domain
MKRIGVAVMAATLVSFATAGAAWAHHSFAAAFDMTSPVTVKGTIVQVRLENPHSWFFVDVKDETGKVERWAFEAGTPSGMIRNGFKASLIKPGAQVTIKGFRARDASQKMGMLRDLTTADGTTYGLFGSQQGADAR